ncbi:hypothetical protein M071_1519, partial [Bacteroides fragilis str. Ds-233]
KNNSPQKQIITKQIENIYYPRAIIIEIFLTLARFYNH